MQKSKQEEQENNVSRSFS